MMLFPCYKCCWSFYKILSEHLNPNDLHWLCFTTEEEMPAPVKPRPQVTASAKPSLPPTPAASPAPPTGIF